MPFNHPYFHGGAVLAQASTYLASFMWSLFTLIDPTANNGQAHLPYQLFTDIMPLRIWAAGGVLISLSAAARLIMKKEPCWFWTLLNGTHALFWNFVAITLVFNYGPNRPAAASCSFVIALLSLYAFTSNPRLWKGTEHHGDQ